MLTVSVTTLRTGALELPAPEMVGAGEGSRAGHAVGWARSANGMGVGLMIKGPGAGAGGGVLGLFREGPGLASGVETTLLMTLLTKERNISQNGIIR